MLQSHKCKCSVIVRKGGGLQNNAFAKLICLVIEGDFYEVYGSTLGKFRVVIFNVKLAASKHVVNRL